MQEENTMSIPAPVNGMRPVHPGEILREDHLKPPGMSANALAQALKVPASRVNDIVLERRGITVDTAATTLALAEQHNCLKLKAKCIKFIVSTPVVLGDVLGTEGYKHLEASCPLVLTELLKSVHVPR